ncbi:MAG: hypothetical protein JWO74_989 [Solirubrobacterales bacterium]|nr:hypothetical protein [Solirubrobacterales bacterium]
MADGIGQDGVTRRRLLDSGAAATLSGSLSPWSQPWAGPSARRWPAAALGAPAAKRVAPSQFLPVAQLRSWHEELDDRGLRATGSPAHERYVDVLHDRLDRIGVGHVHFESATLQRWTPSAWGLDVTDGSSASEVPVAGYIPYSGSIPAGGVTAPLTFVPAGTTPASGSLAGKVALFAVGIPNITFAQFTSLGVAGRIHDPHQQIDPSAPYLRPFIGDFTSRLESIQAGGPAAVVGVLPIEKAEAAGSYFPYDGVIRSTPGVYVAREAGAMLAQLADTGASVRVALSATVETVKTRNVIGLIPGRTNELVVLHSHTDGTNGVEDNGPDVIVAMAQYLARIPRRYLPRTVMVLLTSGHFAGGLGAKAFISRHRRVTIPRIAAAITIEHVGADRWTLHPDGSVIPSTAQEPGAIFQPGSDALIAASHAGLVAGETAPAFVAGPLNPRPKSPMDAAWPGEGQYLWNNGGIATANYISGPTYLLNAGVETAARVNFNRVRRTAIGFTEMALALGHVPKARLAVPSPGD